MVTISPGETGPPAWLAAFTTEALDSITTSRPLCRTVIACPLTVTVPARGVVDGFAAAAIFTVPLPLTLDHDAIVIHAASLSGSQRQPFVPFTARVAKPARPGSSTWPGSKLRLQLVPDCDTVMVCP